MVRVLIVVSRVISFFNFFRKIGRYFLSSEDKLLFMLRIICFLKVYVSIFYIDFISFLILFFFIIFIMYIILFKFNYEFVLKNFNLILIYKKK